MPRAVEATRRLADPSRGMSISASGERQADVFQADRGLAAVAFERLALLVIPDGHTATDGFVIAARTERRNLRSLSGRSTLIRGDQQAARVPGGSAIPRNCSAAAATLGSSAGGSKATPFDSRSTMIRNAANLLKGLLLAGTRCQ